jgi:hypothetical protein
MGNSLGDLTGCLGQRYGIVARSGTAVGAALGDHCPSVLITAQPLVVFLPLRCDVTGTVTGYRHEYLVQFY